MGWLLKKKKKELSKQQEKRAEKIANGLLNVQRRWAALMSGMVGRFSFSTQKVLLVVFIILYLLILLLTTPISRRWFGLE